MQRIRYPYKVTNPNTGKIYKMGYIGRRLYIIPLSTSLIGIGYDVIGSTLLVR